MKYLRWVAYVFLVAAATLWLSGYLKRPATVTLSNSMAAADEVARSANATVPSRGEILECSRSGRDIAALAEQAVASRRRVLEFAKIPRVALESRGARVFWILSFEVLDPPPGSARFIRVEIDDQSGEVTIDGPKAPNQAPEPTATLVTPRAFARVAPSAAVAHL